MFIRILSISLLLFLSLSLLLVGCDGDTDTGAKNDNTGIRTSDSGIQPLSTLEIGDKVVDISWEWGYRSSSNYTGSGELKPVVWVVVAKDHYDVEGQQSHVTLLVSELIGRYAFDDSTDRCHQMPDSGSNHWAESGTTDAEHGIRPFVNNVFFGAMSDNFRNAVLNTELFNIESVSGEEYITNDQVFILSQTELGGTDLDTYDIGDCLPYFSVQEELGERRITHLDGEVERYWTRSPSANFTYLNRFVHKNGKTYRYYSDDDDMGVRPAVNLTSQVNVSETPDEHGFYQIVW